MVVCQRQLVGVTADVLETEGQSWLQMWWRMLNSRGEDTGLIMNIKGTQPRV